MHVVLCSGGLDSSILAWELKQSEKLLVFINYGQYNCEAEYRAAASLAHELRVPLAYINAEHIFRGVHSQILTGASYYSTNKSELPGRNLALLSIVAAAIPRASEAVLYIGIHKTEAAYPDCTVEFVEKANELFSFMTNGRITVSAPYMNISKQLMVEHAIRKGMPRKLIEQSMSCYNGTNCGKCPPCRQRKQIFDYLLTKNIF